MALSDNLVLYSDMTDATSTTVTENTGTYTLTKGSSGNPVSATGLVGNCQDFSADRIATNFDPSATIGTGDFTVMFWFNHGTSTSRRTALDMGDPTTFTDVIAFQFYEIALGSVLNVSSRAGASGFVDISSGSGFFDSNWHQCIFTRTGSTAELYVDNSLQGSSTNAEWANGMDTLCKIGAFYTSNANPHTGLIDEFGIWTRVITSGERADLYNSGAGISYADITGGGGANTTNFFYLT